MLPVCPSFRFKFNLKGLSQNEAKHETDIAESGIASGSCASQSEDPKANEEHRRIRFGSGKTQEVNSKLAGE